MSTLALHRLYTATGASNYAELAAILGVRQSEISDAKRRGVIPEHWLTFLHATRGIRPEWVKCGEGRMIDEAGEAP